MIGSGKPMTTVRQEIINIRQMLVKAHIEDASLNADLMAAAALDIERGRLAVFWNDTASPDFVAALRQMALRRCRHEPLQYILGRWSFLDLEIKVSAAALIPRPETEDVFFAAVKAIEESSFAQKFTFADVGTGTGILGISLAQRFAGARGWLVDLSAAALAVARQNLQQYPDLLSRVAITNSDLLSAFAANSLEVVISNPPYIDHDDMPMLMAEVKDYEPHIALDGGYKGLDIIEKLIAQADEVLVAGGLLIFEHGHGQRQAISRLVGAGWHSVSSGDDLCGRERFFILQRGYNCHEKS